MKKLVITLFIILASYSVAQAESLPFDFTDPTSLDISSAVVSNSTQTFTESQVFESTVTIQSVPFVIAETTFVVTSNSIQAHGLTIFGARSREEIRQLTCDTIPCSVFSTDDFDMYSATGTSIGQWRSNRRGTAP